MNLEKVLLGSCIALALGIGQAHAGADVDCTMCHDSAPVSADHMEIDEVSIESCTMCHESDGADPFFRTLHEQHGEELGCDSCHADDSAERNATLKEMLGG